MVRPRARSRPCRADRPAAEARDAADVRTARGSTSAASTSGGARCGAGDLDAAIAEAAGLDAADVGQIVDVWRYGSPDPVAVSVDVGG